jgi:hypothetical protein
MDALVYQLLSDQAWMLQRLGDAHPETAELLRRSIICAFEAIQAQQTTLADTDWRELSAILNELADIMPDEQFVYEAIVLSKDPTRSRVHVDLRPFLQEIRTRPKSHENAA